MLHAKIVMNAETINNNNNNNNSDQLYNFISPAGPAQASSTMLNVL